MKKSTLILSLGIAVLTSCVPARKFEDLKKKQENCATELEALKSKSADLETANTELTAQVNDLKEKVQELAADTALLGSSLRMKEKQYDKINDLNERIQEQLTLLQEGSARENEKLLRDLNATRIELQQKEDELRILEKQLNEKEMTLNKLSVDLKEREARVKELEDMIAAKDAAVQALKDKVAHALLGFKDKGLTVEQKNGRVYVSMEAKLLFASGSTKVDSEGQKALVELAKVLQDQTELDVLVEGHTDSDAMHGSAHPKDNWELSVLRATSVVKIMLENSEMKPETITAAGRSQYLPIGEDKAKNRRIEVILTPKLDELFEIISNG